MPIFIPCRKTLSCCLWNQELKLQSIRGIPVDLLISSSTTTEFPVKHWSELSTATRWKVIFITVAFSDKVTLPLSDREGYHTSGLQPHWMKPSQATSKPIQGYHHVCSFQKERFSHRVETFGWQGIGKRKGHYSEQLWGPNLLTTETSSKILRKFSTCFHKQTHFLEATWNLE